MNYLRASLAELKRLAIMGRNLALVVLGLWLLVTVLSNSLSNSGCHTNPVSGTAKAWTIG